MQEPNFFQSKIALAKAFPGRKLPMTKLQQLYREIYKSAPKRHVLNLIREENKIGNFQGEGSIYNHKDMDKLLDTYMDFDREMQYYAEALNNAESPTSPTRDQKAGASRNSVAPFFPPSLDQNFTLTKFNLQKVKESEKMLPSTPSQSIHFSTNRVEKASSLPVSPKARVFKSKWPKEIQALKDSIEKHEAIKKSTRRLETNPTQRGGDSSPVKENLADLNNHLKTYLHRLGLEHHKTVMEEAKEISKFSPKKPENITGSSFFSRDDKAIRFETNPDGKKLERNMSIFSKGRRPEHLETMPGDQSPERHLSLFSKGKRPKRFSSIPSLQIPSLNLQEKARGDRSSSPQDNISFSSSSQLSPNLKFKSASQVMSPLLQHSPLLSKNPSPNGTSTNFSLPKIRKSQKAVSLSLSKPKNKRRLNFASRNEMEEIFENCARAQDNIGAIDKKLEKDNKKVIQKLSKMDFKLQRVMQVNFLPQEFIFDDQL